MHVLNTLGTGFLEKVYENALAHELRKRGLEVETRRSVPVFYDGVEVGLYIMDLLVENHLVLEVKTARLISEGHTAQTVNYLKATRKTLALILNFGKRELEWKRLVHQHA